MIALVKHLGKLTFSKVSRDMYDRESDGRVNSKVCNIFFKKFTIEVKRLYILRFVVKMRFNCLCKELAHLFTLQIALSLFFFNSQTLYINIQHTALIFISFRSYKVSKFEKLSLSLLLGRVSLKCIMLPLIINSSASAKECA